MTCLLRSPAAWVKRIYIEKVRQVVEKEAIINEEVE